MNNDPGWRPVYTYKPTTPTTQQAIIVIGWAEPDVLDFTSWGSGFGDFSIEFDSDPVIDSDGK